MPSDALQVNTAHLRELAARHIHAAAEIVAAADLVSGVESRVRISHGVVASSTMRALGRIAEIRSTAGRDLSFESRSLTEDLKSVAHAYSSTDSASGIDVDRFLR